MKKAVVLLALPILAGTAHAQSSVTLYGLADAGIVYVNNYSGHSVVEMVNGQTNGSRFGFRGAEDLGGGLKAIFTLENGFDTSNGKALQGGLLFGRQAFVGLQSSTLGAVTLGRQYDPMTEFIGEIAATSMWAWLGTHPGDFDNLNSNFRVNNSIKYRSPTFNGFTVDGMFAPGGTGGSFQTNTMYTLGARYEHGPLTAALAYDHVNTPAVSAFSATAAPGQPGFTSPGKSPVYSGYLSANSMDIFGAGLAYKIGAGTIGLVYTHTSFNDILKTPTTPNTGTAIFNSYEVNGHYGFTPAFWVGAAYDYTNAGRAKYSQFNFGPDYILSKSTDLQSVFVWQHASGVDSTGHAAVAAIGSLGQSTTPNQIAVKFSLRHRF